MTPMTFARACDELENLDAAAMAAAASRQLELTKPPGSLGRLEAIAEQLCGIAAVCPAPVPGSPAVGVFAGDHGVVASGVTPWPQEVTAQMVSNFAAGGAGINAIARTVGASVHVIDVGVATSLDHVESVLARRVRAGTADLSVGPAMTVSEAQAALDVGASVAAGLVAEGVDLLITGEMGIGNTTATACLVAALSGADPRAVTGRGTGIDDDHLARKQQIVADAVARTEGSSPLDVLAQVGGLEIAALAGFIVGGAASRVPVIIDGVICNAALLVAEHLAPGVASFCIAGHRSVEPAASVVLAELGLDPVLDLELRLGEGTGGCLAVPVVRAAAATLAEMATFGEAGVG